MHLTDILPMVYVTLLVIILVTLSFLPNTDNEPPVVTCPNNVPSVYVAIGVADAVITWSPLPTSNDVVEGVITTIVCEDSPGNVMMSGDRFLVGTTAMTCKSSDSVPNEGTCQFDVTVLGTYTLLCMWFTFLFVNSFPSKFSLINLSLFKS